MTQREGEAMSGRWIRSISLGMGLASSVGLLLTGPAWAATYDSYNCVKHTTSLYPGYSLSRSASLSLGGYQDAFTTTFGAYSGSSGCTAIYGFAVEAGHWQFRAVNNQWSFCQVGYSGIDTDGRADAYSRCSPTSLGYSSNSHSLWVSGSRWDVSGNILIVSA